MWSWREFKDFSLSLSLYLSIMRTPCITLLSLSHSHSLWKAAKLAKDKNWGRWLLSSTRICDAWRVGCESRLPLPHIYGLSTWFCIDTCYEEDGTTNIFRVKALDTCPYFFKWKAWVRICILMCQVFTGY